MHALAAHRAEQEPREAAVPPRADDQQVRAAGGLEQRGRRPCLGELADDVQSGLGRLRLGDRRLQELPRAGGEPVVELVVGVPDRSGDQPGLGQRIARWALGDPSVPTTTFAI